MKKYSLVALATLISTSAMAQDAGAKGGFDFMQFLPLVAIFGIFYFLLIRPQQKKMKQHREMLSTIRRGDRVVTAGGIIGTVSKVESEEELHIDIGEGHVVRVVRSTVSQVIDKTAPVSNAASATKAEKSKVKKAVTRNRKTK